MRAYGERLRKYHVIRHLDDYASPDGGRSTLPQERVRDLRENEDSD
jgi:hypothetical protein